MSRVRRHRVQIVMRFLLPLVTMEVVLMLGDHCRLVWRFEWDTLLPNIGPFPHNSHFTGFSFD